MSSVSASTTLLSPMLDSNQVGLVSASTTLLSPNPMFDRDPKQVGMVSTADTIPFEKLQSGLDLREEIKYSIETNNNFKVLDTEANIPIVEVKAKTDEEKKPKINHNNYRTEFEDFLRNYKEELQNSPKYPDVASQMMKRNYNIFQVQLKDVRKYNPNLGGFFAANYRNLSSEITELVHNFIEDLGLGLLKNGLHFNLIGRK